MTDMKSTNNKNCTFSEKLYPELFIRTWFVAEIFQNQMLKVKIGIFFKKTCHHFKLKDIEVYLEDILGLNLINFVSLDLKLHD